IVWPKTKSEPPNGVLSKNWSYLTAGQRSAFWAHPKCGACGVAIDPRTNVLAVLIKVNLQRRRDLEFQRGFRLTPGEHEHLRIFFELEVAEHVDQGQILAAQRVERRHHEHQPVPILDRIP